ncbi:MAG: response regulator [Bacteroidales bacterium]|nr:response regulator [Bacteroidales bacterium]
MKYSYHIITCLFFLLFGIILYGQNSYTLKSLTKKEGLSSITVYTIIKDKNGFVWIGSADGLNKFDGQKVSRYFYDPGKKTSISSNIIERLYIDSSGRFWVGTFDKLHLYDYHKDEFIEITDIQKVEIKNKIRHVHTIAEDDEGYLWLGTRNGLYKLCVSSSNNIEITDKTYLIKRNDIDNDNYVRQVLIDKNNQLWVGIKYGNKGVVRIDLNDSSAYFYSNDPNNINSLSNNEIRYMDIADDGTLYVETADGLNYYNDSQNQFKRIKTSSDFQYHKLIMSVRTGVHEDISSLFDKNRELIINNSLEYLESSINNEITKQFYSSINKKEILTGYADNKGNIWYGTLYNGVYYLCRNNFGFKTFSNCSQVELNQMVRSLSNDESTNTIWFSAYDEIYEYRRNSDQLIRYSYKSGNNPFNLNEDDVIGAIFLDSRKKLYIGYNDGLLIYNTISRKLERKLAYLNNDFKSSATVPGNQFQCFFETSDNLIYIGYYGKSISTYNQITGELVHYNNIYPEILNSSVFSILESEKRVIWLGTSHGVVKIDFNNHEATKFRFDPMNIIKSIVIDQKQRIWAGGNGLLYLNKITQEFEYDTVVETKYNIRNILAQNNALWLSTQLGLIKYLPDSASYILYSVEHGIRSEDLFSSIGGLSQNGEYIIGSDKGLTMFFPDSVITQSDFPEIRLKECYINNVVMNIGQELNGQVILTESIINTDRIDLNYKNNSFSFEFSAIEFLTPDKILFKYKLEGFDNIWIDVEEGSNKVVYTNIPPGEYKLLIVSTNTLGQWNKTPFELELNIAFPFWQTWWFRVLVVIIIILIINTIIRLRLRFFKENEKILKNKVHERTLELEENQIEIIAQKEELERQRDALNELNKKLEEQNREIIQHRNHLEDIVENRTKELIQAKVKAEESDRLKSMFLANMSHEIRTPMNAILGFSSLLNKPDITEREKITFINYINTNGESLLRLIEDIIDISQIQTHQLKFNIQSFVIDDLLQQLYQQYKYTADEKGIQLQLKIPDKKTIIYSDITRLKQIINNLLSNAFKFTDKGSVSFGYRQDTNNTIEFFVQDTGIGIAEDIIDEIFNKFIKDERSMLKKYRGNGLGLSISKSLVELMGGKIWVQSKFGSGSTFYFCIPVRTNLNEVKISDESYKELSNEKPYLGGKKVLIVEDEEANRRLLMIFMKDTSSEVIVAENGKEAVDIVEKYQGNINIILMDIKMPVMDGITALKHIKKKYKHIPIIAQTAFVQEHEKQRFLSEGFIDLITKPINRSVLYNTVQYHISDKKN